ncbi:MAG: glycoside hydrolase family 32 protein [Oscillibacter sp.]|nr:glycoside hydrolase family 32 protein [Oscillibacter sp.]
MMSEELRKAREFEAAYGPQIPESERPLFHVTAGVGWLNDPNGFSVYRGEYHLFYQYHPYSTRWGPMHWGHLKTQDFVKWERLPVALAPDCDYDRAGCWSGGALELPDGRQLLMYTGRRTQEENGREVAYQTQCLAVGDGRDYQKYEGNPVLTAENLPSGASPYDFRDPKIWREPDGTYHAVTVTRMEDGGGAVLLYASDDGFAWRFERVLTRCRNEYGTMWECPDFFSLDGQQVIFVSPMEMRPMGLEFHVGYGAVYMLGRYHQGDGAFSRETVRSLDYGLDFYAAQTLETLDGRRVMIAWMQNWATVACQTHGARCFGEMTIPRELSIRDGQLIQNPVRELERYRVNPVIYRDILLTEEISLEGVRGRVLDMTVSVAPTSGNGYRAFKVRVAKDGEREIAVQYTPDDGVITLDRSRCGAAYDITNVRKFLARRRDGELKLRFIMDRHSLELFVNDGEQAASLLLYAPESAEGLTFEAEGGIVRMNIEKYGLEVP